MGVHVFPILNPCSHLPPHPSGSSQCISLSTFSHASNLGWQSVSHKIICMVQCYFPKSSHPHLLPQSPKVCSLYLCLFCCLAYRVIITIFLNSIYMCEYAVLVFFFLAYFTLYNWLQFHPSHQNWFKLFSFLIAPVLFVEKTFLCPLIFCFFLWLFQLFQAAFILLFILESACHVHRNACWKFGCVDSMDESK